MDAAPKESSTLSPRWRHNSFDAPRSRPGTAAKMETAAPGSLLILRWREADSNLYGAFPVKRLFWVVLTVFCSERERPFFVPSPGIRFAERAEGVKGPKR